MNFKIKRRFDSLSLGGIIGFVMPIVMVFIFYTMRHSQISFWEFLKATVYIRISSSLISLAAIPNLASFFVFLQTSRYQSARGVILATIILAFIAFGFKFTIG